MILLLFPGIQTQLTTCYHAADISFSDNFALERPPVMIITPFTDKLSSSRDLDSFYDVGTSFTRFYTEDNTPGRSESLLSISLSREEHISALARLQQFDGVFSLTPSLLRPYWYSSELGIHIYYPQSTSMLVQAVESVVIASAWMEKYGGDGMLDMLLKANDWIRIECEAIRKSVEEVKLSVKKIADSTLFGLQ